MLKATPTKYIVKTKKISSNSLTESATNGLAERIFRETKEHNLDFVNRVDSIGSQEQVIGFVEGYISQLRKRNMSRKAALTDLKSIFCCAFKISPTSIFAAGKDVDGMYGTYVQDDRFYLIALKINLKKPHASRISKVPVGFSKHAMARILFRYKPHQLENNLVGLAVIVESTFETLEKTNEAIVGDKAWLYLPKLGGFLLCKEANSYTLITVIKDKLMSEQQISEGKDNLDEIASKDTDLLKCIEQEVVSLRNSKAIEHSEISKVSAF